MGKVIEALLATAYQDTQLLISNDKKGDDFSTLRNVDFILLAKSTGRPLISLTITDMVPPPVRKLTQKFK